MTTQLTTDQLTTAPPDEGTPVARHQASDGEHGIPAPKRPEGSVSLNGHPDQRVFTVCGDAGEFGATTVERTSTEPQTSTVCGDAGEFGATTVERTSTEPQTFTVFGDAGEFGATPVERTSTEPQTSTVFGDARELGVPAIELPESHALNTRLQMSATELLEAIPTAAIPAVFFDPQYRGVLDQLSYGNEGKKRGRQRAALAQMPEEDITEIIAAIDRVLISSGHLFLWMDKFHLCTGFTPWLNGTSLEVVDLVTWHKMRIGMGYRTRRCSEYLVVLQKTPRRAKGVWSVHNIPDVWQEQTERNGGHPHRKPLKLQSELITAVTNPGDIVVDPAAGSFSVMEAAQQRGRNFLGCDLVV